MTPTVKTFLAQFPQAMTDYNPLIYTADGICVSVTGFEVLPLQVELDGTEYAFEKAMTGGMPDSQGWGTTISYIRLYYKEV